MKYSLEVLIKSEKEQANLKVGQLRLFRLRNRKKRKKRKMNTPQRLAGHHQVDQWMHNGSLSSEREKNAEKIFEEI